MVGGFGIGDSKFEIGSSSPAVAATTILEQPRPPFQSGRCTADGASHSSRAPRPKICLFVPSCCAPVPGLFAIGGRGSGPMITRQAFSRCSVRYERPKNNAMSVCFAENSNNDGIRHIVSKEASDGPERKDLGQVPDHDKEEMGVYRVVPALVP